MSPDELLLLADLHRGGPRQGPGGDEETARALQLSGLDRRAPLRIADIGCGTGASTLVLARLLENARITAIDLLEDFLETLVQRAKAEGLADRIEARSLCMEELDLAEEDFDAIWSEGAIYNIGFERGAKEWKRFLKPGGLLVASEITWLTARRPAQIQRHWEAEYPEIGTAAAKIGTLEALGYTPVSYFALPEHCWLENYYHPLAARLDGFLERHGHSEIAREIVDAERREIDLYRRFKSFYSYGMYIARKE